MGPPPGLLMPSLSLVGDIPSNGKNRVMITAQILGVPVPGVERQGPETQGRRAGSSVPPSGQCRCRTGLLPSCQSHDRASPFPNASLLTEIAASLGPFGSGQQEARTFVLEANLPVQRVDEHCSFLTQLGTLKGGPAVPGPLSPQPSPCLSL